MFDSSKTGFIETEKISEILQTLGQKFDEEDLEVVIKLADPSGAGKINFDRFTEVMSSFLEDEDAEMVQNELKEAFRLYDKEGNGYITTATLREILAALDDKLSSDDLDEMITEIDQDGSGTVDFDAFLKFLS